MVLEFYYDLRSQPCRAVHLLLKLNNVDFKAHKIDLRAGDHLKPEYLKINPFHKVPLLKDGDFILTESVAMLRYIATKYNVPEHWYPRKDVKKQARVDEFLNWHHTGLRKPCIELLLPKLQMRTALTPTRPKIPRDEDMLKQREEVLVKALKEFDEYFLKGKPFIAGDEISAADLAGFCEVMQLIGVECTAYKDNKNVDEWLKRVESNLGSAYEESLTALNSFADIYKNAK